MMGKSGGRSHNHPAGQGARRKFTQREREHIDPPWDEVTPRYRLTSRGEKLRDGLFTGGVIFLFGGAIGVIVSKWFGA